MNELLRAIAAVTHSVPRSPSKDQVDVIEMVKGGIDTKRCRDYLVAHAPALVAAFDESVAQAEAEER